MRLKNKVHVDKILIFFIIYGRKVDISLEFELIKKLYILRKK